MVEKWFVCPSISILLHTSFVKYKGRGYDFSHLTVLNFTKRTVKEIIIAKLYIQPLTLEKKRSAAKVGLDLAQVGAEGQGQGLDPFPRPAAPSRGPG